MIIRDTLGSILCLLAVSFFPFTSNLPPWFALSLSRPFVFSVQILLVNISPLHIVVFLLSRALSLSILVQVLMLRMVSLSASIVISLRQLVLSCLLLMSHLIFGLKLSLPLPFLSIGSPLLLSRDAPLLSVSLVRHPSTVTFDVSVVSAMCFFHLESAPS